MNNTHNPLAELDDLDDLRQDTPATADEALLDLDELLAESVTLANAKRAKAKGQKLTPEQSDLLEANRIVEQADYWKLVTCYAHFVEVECGCGGLKETRFEGWYSYETQRRGTGRRLVQVPRRGECPAFAVKTKRVVGGCLHCAPKDLPVATNADLDLLKLLGA